MRDITKNTLFCLVLFFAFLTVGFGQPEIEWERSFGGSKDDNAQSIQQTSDGGYIIGGNTASLDTTKISADYWIIKLNSQGHLEWEKNYGGSTVESLASIQQTNDNGYIVAGYTFSSDGDVSNNKGLTDYWIVKLNDKGDLDWEKSYGGSSYDYLNSIQQTNDAGYLIAGSSFSSDGDVGANYGNGANDYWIAKLDKNGILEWEKNYGGSGGERANSIQQTNDGGYVVAGESRSSDGDVNSNNGDWDYWIIKLNNRGDLEWEKNYGGSESENAFSIQQTNDGGYIVTGDTFSSDGDVSENKGKSDYWIIKLNNEGNLEWEKTYGGSKFEKSSSIQQTSDGAYIIAGHAESTDGDVSNNKGITNYWIIKLDNNGNLTWEKTYGGSYIDTPSSIKQTNDQGYIIAGSARSADGDVTKNNGDRDFWIIKLAPNCKIADSLALVDLYNATNGPNWTTKKWDLTQPMSTWEGIILNENGCVLTLELENNNLAGSLPESIGNLSQLETISLWDNKLTGSIPTSIGNLSNLQYFSIYNNQLTSGIPAEIGNLTELTWLSLEGNTDLGGTIPPTLGNLTKLEGFYLSSSGLTGTIPDDLQNLTAVKQFSLASNLELTGTIPTWFSNFTQLERLFLFGNNFTGTIPASLGELPTLTHLYLHENSLSGCFPDNFSKFCSWTNQGDDIDNAGYNFKVNRALPWSGNLTDFCSGTSQIGATCDDGNSNTSSSVIDENCDCVEEVIEETCRSRDSLILVTLYNTTDGVNWTKNDNWLSDKPINEWFGIEINNEGCITTLNLRNNNLTNTIPSELGNLSNLRRFSIGVNKLIGEIPIELGNLSNIEEMDLGYNNLEGVIPSEIGNLSKLKILELLDNNLTGSVPKELGNLSNLEKLFLSSNELSGEIPTELGDLNNLFSLFLNENQLTGKIPIELGNLNRLQYLSLYENKLTGNIPFELGNLNNLTSLALADNSLTGNIPPELGNLNNLTTLALADNSLTGNIPTELGNLSNLEQLYFSSNELSGSIPTELGNLSRLNWLELHNNKLEGNIPPKLGNLSSLSLLELQNNRLEGSIPPELGSLSNLRYLELQNNSLEGSIPPELGNLSSLNWLELHNNRLEGNIPPELGNLSNLRHLDLSNNLLTGSIPSEIGSLSLLTDLNLSNNQLTGSIPTQFGQLTKLFFLHLEFNNLEGGIPKELGTLNTLFSLFLNNNKLIGIIPSELGDLEKLTTISLSDNDLSDCYPSNWIRLCEFSLKNYNELSSFPGGYNFTNNPKLPWKGDISLWCNNEPQIGAPCDDGNPNTENDKITEDCECKGEVIETCRSRDSLALVALYNATGGVNWEKNDNWLTTKSIDEWYGVELNNEGCVTKIALSNNSLSGEIPSELGNLSNLISLSFFLNQLSGNIPIELGNLSSLEELDLGQNQLSGSIPTELGKLSNLTSLSLGFNNLTGNIPKELGNLSNLLYLHFSSNNLTGSIPSTLSNLSKLKALQLDFNKLTNSLPLELVDLNNLEKLGLSYNSLSGNIPPELGNLDNLTSLSLGVNQLTGTIPPDLGNLNQLTFFSLHSNQLTGNIPAELGNLNNLRTLSLYSNQLTGSIPTELGSLSNLQSLSLYSNQLTSSIPTELSNLDKLENLFLYSNNLTGNIPTGLGNLSQLNKLGLSDNQLNGCIPDDLQRFCSLGQQEYNENGFLTNNGYNLINNPMLPWQGNIEQWCNDEPQIGAPCDDGNPNTNNDKITEDCECKGEIIETCRSRDSLALVALYNATDGANWTNNENWLTAKPINEWFGVEINNEGCVTRLHLSSNNLTNKIPSELGNLVSLLSLSLSSNKLTGNIPTQLGNLVNSTYISLSSNELTGNIPIELGNLSGLERLNLFNNQLTGSIPTELGNLSSLERLNLYENQLTGNIPSKLGNLTNLEALSMEFNQLTGNIPIELGNLKNLKWLILHDNQLTGNIPPELGNLNILESLILFNNQLTGNIPVELSRLNNLDLLMLFDNQLTGNIPPELSRLNNLAWLMLGENQLTGNIPTELGSLSELSRLYLNSNQLTGPIPKEFGNLVNLTELALSDNQLDGCYPDDLLKYCNLTPQEHTEEGFLTTDNSYNLTNNPALPWQGDMEQWCNNKPQIGAPCDDGNPDTDNDKITEDCECQGEVVETCRSRDSLVLVALYSATDGANWKTTWDLNKPIDNWFGVELDENNCVAHIDLSTNIGNNLKGRIPKELGNLTAVTGINLGGNEFVGSIPSEIGNLESLISLEIQLSKLTGSIPAELSKLKNLEVLDLGFNSIEDSISSWLYPLENLKELNLFDNKISGILPNELGNMNNLEILNLGKNNLTGTIPTNLSNLSNLKELVLRKNNLDGVIPSTLGNIINLKKITLNENNLSGNIPSELGDLSNLTSLYLHDNELSGNIPSDLSRLTNLKEFFLHNNQLEDCIPYELNNILCSLGFRTNPDGVANGYNLTSNPSLPWQGNLEQWCNNEPQIGAPCDDGNPATGNDKITEDCECLGTSCQPQMIETTKQICQDETYIFGTQSITKSGEFKETFQSIAGCDSTVTLTLIILKPIPESLETVRICEGEGYPFGHQNLTVEGLYYDTLQAQNGCDSIIQELLVEVTESAFIEAKIDTFIFDDPSNEVNLAILENDEYASNSTVIITILNQPSSGIISAENIGNEQITFELPDQLPAKDIFSYQVCVEQEGCETACSEAEVFLFFEQDCIAAALKSIPKAFAPNSTNQLNTVFNPLLAFELANCTVEQQEAQLTIMNRWGEVVFKNEIYMPWDGRRREGDQRPLPPNVYYYIFKYGKSKKEIAKGAINLVKLE